MPSARKVVEITLTAGLFGVSALLSIRLFWELAGDDKIAAFLLASVAVMFEGAKVALWFYGVKRGNPIAIALVAILVALSLFASFASALAVIQKAGIGTQAASTALDDESANIERIEKELSGLTSARDALPPDYIAARTRYEALIAPLRAELSTSRSKLAELRRESASLSRSDTSTLFFAVALVFRAERSEAARLGDKVRMIYLVAVAGMLEIVAMAMAFFEIRGDVGSRRAALEYVELGGIVHLKTGDKTACGRGLEGSREPAPNARPCPSCSMKATALTVAK